MKFVAGTHWSGRAIAIAMAASLVATACTASTTLTETAASTQDPTTQDPTTQDPTTQVDSSSASIAQVEPTAVATARPQVEPEEPATPTENPSPDTPSPTTTGPTGVQLDLFRGDAILGLDASGTYAYAGTTVAWEDETACDATPAESLAVVDLVAAAAGDVVPFGAGLRQAGDVRQMMPGVDPRAVMVLSQCGSFDERSTWMQLAQIGDDGLISDMGQAIPLTSQDGTASVFLTRWIDNDTIEVRVIAQSNPDDPEAWVYELRQFNVRTGALGSVEQDDYFDESGPGRIQVGSVDAFDYYSIDDPGGSVGCEGFGVSRTIQVASGADRWLALGEDALTFSNVSDFHAVGGYVSWTSGCEGYTSAYVGKLLADGSITDAHVIRTYGIAGAEESDFSHYRVTADGFLSAVGREFSIEESAMPQAVFLRYDLSTDPDFVNTASPPVDIDVESLVTAIDGVSGWHAGETLAADSDRECGGRTLYGKTSSGFVRAFPSGVEVDAIVDIDASETQVYTYDDGAFSSRTLVLSTVCPGAYDGVRVWFGIEGDSVHFGLRLERADLEEVRQVVSVRYQFGPDSDTVEKTLVEVENFDGTVTEVELVSLPES